MPLEVPTEKTGKRMTQDTSQIGTKTRTINRRKRTKKYASRPLMVLISEKLARRMAHGHKMMLRERSEARFLSECQRGSNAGARIRTLLEGCRCGAGIWQENRGGEV